MKLKSLCLILVVVAVGLSITGCGCFQQAMKGETAAPAAGAQKTTPAEQKKEIAVSKGAGEAAVAAALQDVFFDFDKYAIRPGDAEILKKDYAVLQSSKGKVRVEGNCDERGTVEYNLALGQKRADAAKAYLIKLGADDKRLETISYGKEKPVDPGHNEAAWAKNRRVHFTPLP
jgi:peptidoglycan-associated lipoprotein